MRQISQQRLVQITGARTASEQCAVLRQIGVHECAQRIRERGDL